MIDFATLQGWTIPEGVVTQITDASGRVLWSAVESEPIVLEVEKITSNTYAAETTYTGEQFVLLNIHPKNANGVVNVAYGNLTKTLTFSGLNAQTVFFGTFNGVSDEVETPASGELTIEGDCSNVSIGTFAKSSKSSTNYCNCVTGFVEFGAMNAILINGFRYCTGMISVILPSSIKSIGATSFWGCTGLREFFIPSSVSNIEHAVFYNTNINNPVTVDANNPYFYVDGNCLMKTEGKVLLAGFNDSTIPTDTERIERHAFYGSTGVTSVTIPASVTHIGSQAFGDCTGLTSVTVIATTPPTASTDTFGSLTPTITVPAGCGDTYKAADGWSTYADYIVEAS